MKRAMVSDLKVHLSAYLAEVRRGESVVVCDRTTPIARLVPDRLRLEGALDDEQVGAFQAALAAIERTIDRVRLTRLVLGRAALPMATPVKTLDALHLASALLWRERRAAELLFATHDPQQARAARALGFDCVGVS